jgi:hypothetical protein
MSSKYFFYYVILTKYKFRIYNIYYLLHIFITIITAHDAKIDRQQPLYF